MTTVKSHSNTAILAAVGLVVLMTTPAYAATCNVPSGSFPNIQTAVDDIGCGPIVIAAGSYPESPIIDRTVNLTGAGSTLTFVQGQVQATSGTVHLVGMHISAVDEALWSHSGAEVSGFDLVVVSGVDSTLIFSNGFEDGTTSAWSAVSP